MKEWKWGVSSAPDVHNAAPILLGGDICTCLREASAIGFDAIEYHTVHHAEFDYNKIRDTMEETGCRISAIVTGRLYTQLHYSLTSENPENEKRAVEGMLRYIDIAAELGAGIVLGWAKGNIRESSSREAYFQRLTRNLRILDEVAAARNVPIMIEVINHYEVDAFMTARETVAYLRENGFKSCYVHLDAFHMLLEEEDFPAAIRIAGPYLGYFHLADTTRWYPGSGSMDYKPILRALDEIGYRGSMTIECFPHNNGKDTAARGLAYMNGLGTALF